MTPHDHTPAPGTSANLRHESPDLQPQAPFERALRVPCSVAPRLGTLALGVLVLGALDCSRGARAVRLPAPEADAFIYQIDCHTNIESCRKKAAELCPIGYDVLKSAGASVEPPRVDTEPGPRSTGSPYQRPDWVGQIIVACGNPSDAAPGARRTLPEAAAPVPAPALEARTPGPDQLCVPGVTQLCLGPGACRGAQPCLADGRGYGVCDCGAASASSDVHTGGARATAPLDAGVSHP